FRQRSGDHGRRRLRRLGGSRAMGKGAATMPEDPRVLVYEMEIPIRWGDMDAMGHVNNTVYFRFMEQARLGWCVAMTPSPDPLGEGPVIVNAACTFTRQLEYPGTVLARHYVGALGRSSIMTYVDMERTDDPGRVYASGSAKVVWVNFPR